MLRRTGFKKPQRERQPLPAPRPPMLEPRPIRQTAPIRFEVVGRAKEIPVRSEAYRRLVAMLPCAYCHIEGYSQAAHPPPTGKGIKECDLECFPMCCTRPGTLGCHALFDRYELIPKTRARIFARMLASETRDTIEGNGMWPAGLPKYTQTQ